MQVPVGRVRYPWRTNAAPDKPPNGPVLAPQVHYRARACVPIAMRVQEACLGRDLCSWKIAFRVGMIAIAICHSLQILAASDGPLPMPLPFLHVAIVP